MFGLNMKKALALLASVLILCSLIPVGALLVANADSNNLLSNGGFEDGESGWSFNSGSHAIVNDAHEGSNALSLTNPGLWAEGAITTIPVSPNTDYTITWWCKAPASTKTFNLYVMDGTSFANMTTSGGQNWMNGFTGNWQQKTYKVNSGTATSMMLKFSTESSNPGTVLLDDISVVKVGGGEPDTPDTPDSAVILDMDFEDGNAGFEGASVVTDGSKCLKWTANGGWSSTQIVASNVKRDTDYVVTFKAKGSVAGGMGTTLQDANWGPYWNGPSFNVTTAWQEFKIEFNTASYPTTEGKMFFKFQDVGVAMDLYIDDLKMVEKTAGGDEPDVPDSNNMLVNGDFEADAINPWENLWGSNQTEIVTGRNDGSALKVTSVQWGHVRQKVDVEPNTDYVITVWHKNTNNITLLVKDGGDTKNVAQGPLTSGNEWTKSTVEFNSGSYTSVYVSLMGGEGGGQGTFDDITMTKKGEEPGTPEEPIAGFNNGGFETGDTTGWNTPQTATVEEAAAHDGTYGAHLKGNGGWGGMLDQTVAVKAGKTYEITFWVKVLATGVNVQIKDGTAAGANLSSDWIDTNTGAEWVKRTHLVTPTTDAIFVNLCGSGASPEEVYVDSFEITELKEASFDGYITNGDFETGKPDSWTNLWDSSTIEMVAGHKGEHALKGTATGEYNIVYQDVTVEPNTDYTITVWAKDASDSALWIKNAGGNGDIANTNFATGSAWSKTTLTFNSGANSTIWVGLMGITPGATYTVDDITMAKAGDNPGGGEPDVPAYPTELINGDFEDGDEGWTMGASASISEEGHKSSAALKMENPSAYAEAAMQAVSVQKDTNYVIKWYAKRISGSGAFNLILMNGDNGNYSVDGQAWMNETSGDWVKYEVVLSTGSNNVIKFKFTAEGANAGAILIDDVTMIIEGSEPVDPTASLIKNGSFEDGKDDWNFGGESAVVNDPYEGSNSAKLVNDSAWGVGVEQYVKVEKNTDYVIRFYTKRAAGKGTWMFSLMDGDTIDKPGVAVVNLEVTSGQKWFDHTTTNKWEEHVLEFNSGEVTKVLVKWGPQDANAGSYYLDYIGMWIKGNEPSPDNPDNPVVPPKAQMYMTSYGVLNNRPVNQDVNMLSNPSFEKSGGQWKEGFTGETVSVVKDSTTLFGDKSLYFNTSGIEEETKLIFWVDVEPNTDYVFSTWLKGAFLSDDNRGLATIGVVDENGTYVGNWSGQNYSDIKRFLDGTRQIVPTAWDNEWHLRGIEINTGEYTKLGIALSGKNSQMWIDDMALFEVGNGTKYMSEMAAGYVSLRYDIDDGVTCKDKDSLIPDPTFSKGVNDFWKTSYGWRNGFLTTVENKYEYGTSLKYTASSSAAPLSVIKTIKVEPNTEYIFAVDVKILEDGWGKLLLCDGKKRQPDTFMEVTFDSYDYDEEMGYYGWYTAACKFDTGVYDTISLVIVDDGGEALLDNMRLFKSNKVASVTDKFVVPPEEPTPDAEEPSDDDWYEGDDWYDPDIPVDPDVPVDDPVIENPEPFQPEVDEPEPVPDTPVAPVVVDDEGSDAWIWIAAAGGATLLAGAGVFVFFFLKKKKTTPAE